MRNTDNNDLDKMIKIKELEIEKLKLEQSNNSNNSATNMGYRNVVIRNALLLLVIGGVLFLPWGSLEGAVNGSGYGSNVSFSSKLTASGFSLGMVTFTVPFIMVWTIAFISAILNKVRAVAITSIIGIFISIWILLVLGSIGNVDSSVYVDGFNSKVSTGFKTSPIIYIPLLGFIILLFNFSIKKELNNDKKLPTKEEEEQRREMLLNKIEEKNKKHLFDRNRLKKFLTIDAILTICFFFNTIFGVKDYTFREPFIPLSLILLLAIIFMLMLAEFLQHTVIKNFYYELLCKAIILGVFFIAQIYFMFNPSISVTFNFSDMGLFKEIFPVITLFIITGIILYISLMEIACIKLNYYKIEKK
ncbi:hypothetical protein [Sphingobacterium siyangense]|uniref:hypothetical protein n=1 Tax=Sphingobacterium siyangense TaxID=459529 RepID=UPI003DA4D937